MNTHRSHSDLNPDASQAGSGIAIVGMSCILPGADSLTQYWENILNCRVAITQIPPERFDSQKYFSRKRRDRDCIYSKWGGFLNPVQFNPVEFGIPPSSLPYIDAMQLLALRIVRDALNDSGYAGGDFANDNTAVVVAASGGFGELGQAYVFRSLLPLLNLDERRASWPPESGTVIPPWTSQSFPGLLVNLTAGRVANRFDLGGPNYVVDAACASSLAALRMAMYELESGATKMVIVASTDTNQSPFAYLCFSRVQALSPSGRCCPFDESADGTVISEGAAALVLKRLEDAVRDGNRIYAVVKGVGASSDGRAKGLTTPDSRGQRVALERAYSRAEVAPCSIRLIEAHGTSTVLGDLAEAAALIGFFESRSAAPASIAVGSVKGNIGHSKAVAGLAGLIKTALALYHRILPPTVSLSKPITSFTQTVPIYLNTVPQSWERSSRETPLRAGVSAFGFGGTNFHAVLEEYSGVNPVISLSPVRRTPSNRADAWTIRSGRVVREAESGIEVLSQAPGQISLPPPISRLKPEYHVAPESSSASIRAHFDSMRTALDIHRRVMLTSPLLKRPESKSSKS